MALQTVTMDECARNCYDTLRVCQETLDYCIDRGGKFAEANHLSALLDCIATTQTCAELCQRNSTIHDKMCGVCANACRKVMESCRNFEEEQLQMCAKTAQTCMESCEAMSSS